MGDWEEILLVSPPCFWAQQIPILPDQALLSLHCGHILSMHSELAMVLQGSLGYP